jgi:hypothetical protein
MYVCVCLLLQDTVAEMAKDIARRKGSSSEADDLYQFIKKVGGCGCVRWMFECVGLQVRLQVRVQVWVWVWVWVWV